MAAVASTVEQEKWQKTKRKGERDGANENENRHQVVRTAQQ